MMGASAISCFHKSVKSGTVGNSEIFDCLGFSRHMKIKLRGAVSPIFSVTLNGEKIYLFCLKRENNDTILLKITLLVHRN